MTQTSRSIGRAGPELFIARLRAPVDAEVDIAAHAMLSAAEQSRAERFRSAEIRRRFQLSKLATRGLLSEVLGIAPQDVPLDAAGDGRPVVRDGDGGEALSISITHRGEWLAIALAPAEELIGVDLEQLVTPSAIESLSAVALTPAERAWLAARPIALRPLACTILWTIKEAAAKAVPGGVQLPLASWEVAVQEGAASISSHRGSEAQKLAIHSWVCVAAESRPGWIPPAESNWLAAGHEFRNPLNRITLQSEPTLAELSKVVEFAFAESCIWGTLVCDQKWGYGSFGQDPQATKRGGCLSANDDLTAIPGCETLRRELGLQLQWARPRWLTFPVSPG